MSGLTRQQVFLDVANGTTAGNIAMVKMAYKWLLAGNKGEDLPVNDLRRIPAMELEQFGFETLKSLGE